MTTDFTTIKGAGESPVEKRIYFDEYKGKTYLHIREFYKDKKDGEWKPSQKGITFSQDYIPALKEAVAKLEQK